MDLSHGRCTNGHSEKPPYLGTSVGGSKKGSSNYFHPQKMAKHKINSIIEISNNKNVGGSTIQLNEKNTQAIIAPRMTN